MTDRFRTRPAAPGRALLFSDVDDTLIDDRTPVHAVADGWAAVVRRVEVVLVSSRTLHELLYLLGELDADADLIAENGACTAVRSPAVARALGATETIARHGRRWYIAPRGAPAQEVLEAFHRARARHVADVKLAGELPRARRAALLDDGWGSARLALRRRFSVLTEPPDRGTQAWLEALRRDGFQACVGGRWLAIWRGPDKGGAASAYLAARAEAGLAEVAVAAVGDAANDASLLRAVPRRFMVRRPTGGYDPTLLAVPGVIRLRAPGHAGWRRAAALLAKAPARFSPEVV